jgi:hypothetical protein
LPAAAGCSYQSVATADAAVYAVQACGPDATRLHGPAGLVRLDVDGHVTGRWPLGDCTDGNALAADPTQGVVVAAYLFCNPPLPGTTAAAPLTAVDVMRLGAPHRVATLPGGTMAYDNLTW